MFDLEAKGGLPREYIELQTFWVRGALGPVKVVCELIGCLV